MSLHEDIFLAISQHLSNKQNIMLTGTSTKMNQLKHKIIYKEKVRIKKITHLSYFDNFENINICGFGYFEHLPKKIKHIYCDDRLPKSDNLKFMTTLTFKGDDFSMIKNNIPSSVTKLIISPSYGVKYLRNIDIPHSVTYLKFSGYWTGKPICHIPATVTHLIFNPWFNRSIELLIPSSVTHLAFGDCFDQPIKNNIPSSVTHLTFGRNFDQYIRDSIPSSVISLTLCPYDEHKKWKPTWYYLKDVPKTIPYVTLKNC
uniref:F-box domain-containing protein n=1 Tax=viral metagenome TaxID=1070528 RepID=A0A6C0CA10_9ZZZZ